MNRDQQTGLLTQFNLLQLLLLLTLLGANFGSAMALEKDTGSNRNSLNETLDQSANLPTAVLWYQEKATNGDVEAQYNLGNVYELGFGVKINYELAAKWYKDAAEQGHQQAQLKLGMLYILGKGVRESTIKGGKWIRSAAEQGNSVAQTLQDKVLSHNMQQDFDMKLLIESVRLGLIKSEKNAEETIDISLQKLEKANREAPQDSRFVKGVTGSGAKKGSVGNRIPAFLEKKPLESTPLGDSLAVIRRQANEGNAEAQYQLARLYEKGEQVERSRGEAMHWYFSAANQMHGASQYRLGLAYLYGLGTEANINTARKWLNKAKLANDPNAKLFLQHVPLAEITSIDITIALGWYLERSLNGDGEAMLALGHMYEKGWGVQQNIKEAKKWYGKARIVGTKGASIQLRRMKIEDSDAIPESSNPPAAVISPIENESVGDPQVGSSGTNKSTNKVKPINDIKPNEKILTTRSGGKNENLDAAASIDRVSNKLLRSAKNAWVAMFRNAGENAITLVLAFFGIVMGALVFRKLRKDETSVF